MKASELVTDANVNAWTRGSRSPFPHMSPYDSAVWAAFLEVAPFPIGAVLYDVALGGASARYVADSDDLKAMWVTLIKKRVDAVADVAGEVWVCEVKPVASMAALGQALTYAFLWNAERRSKLKARAVVVCARVDEDVQPVFSFFGVRVVVVSPAEDGAPASLVKILEPVPGA